MTKLAQLIVVRAQIVAPSIRAGRAVHPIDALCVIGAVMMLGGLPA